MEKEHGDTWRLWGPHKLEFMCHMESSSWNFESMGILNVLGWVISIIQFSIYIIGRNWKEMQLTWERKSHFVASGTLELDSLALWQQWGRCYETYDTNKIWMMTSEISDMSGQNRASNSALMWVGEAQWVPTQIGGRWKGRKVRTHGKYWSHTQIRIGLSLWMDW